ncbi:uncharacterized protein LOC118761447 [Octopus sinensis]|uniref:Uncharacterized protein LOC118761447 n=1 Tax=Octopus sinensis TaxID=2607531 RepID=A0A7E6EJT6_9MOLL|nr:uncharacterized protein LOC118761447 [Octopus sinensis]
MRANPPKHSEETTYRDDYRLFDSRPKSVKPKLKSSMSILPLDSFEMKTRKVSVYQKDYNSTNLFIGNISGNYDHIKAKVKTFVYLKVDTGLNLTSTKLPNVDLTRSVLKKSIRTKSAKCLLYYPKAITEDTLEDIRGMDFNGQLNIRCRQRNKNISNPWAKAIKLP